MDYKQKYKSLEEVHSSIDTTKYTNTNPIRRFLAFLGPAYLIGIGYVDPGNWATDIAGGSQFGYKLLWVLLLSNVIALLLQSLCARLGLVTSMDLAQASHASFKKIPNFALYVLAEIAIIACELAEIIGMAIGLNLLFGIPLLYGVFISVITTFLIFFLMHKGIRKMEMFIIFLVIIISGSLITNLFVVKPDMLEVVKGLQPTSLSGASLYIAIAIIGATVMPHNLYLHSSLVQTRRIEKTTTAIKKALKYNIIDTAFALNIAFIVNASILILAATAFYQNGYFHIEEIEDAHELLYQMFGPVVPALFAIGLIAAGQSSTITGTLAGQIVMEGYLNLKMKLWIRRIITRTISIIPAVIAIIYFGDSSIVKLLILSQVVLSIQLSFAVIPLIRFCSHKGLMKSFTISKKLKFISWTVVLLIVALNLQLVYEETTGWLSGSTNVLLYVVVITAVIFFISLLIYVLLAPLPQHINMKEGMSIQEVEKNFDYILAKETHNNILIALEFNKNDISIIKSALNQGGTNAKYLLYHVLNSAATMYHGSSVGDKEYMDDNQSFKKYAAYLTEKGYNIEYQMGYGKIADNIAKVANKENIDLIVMGNHKHKWLGRLLFGSTASSLMSKTRIPIIIAHKYIDETEET